jgi:D-glycerate 3-kinase
MFAQYIRYIFLLFIIQKVNMLKETLLAAALKCQALSHLPTESKLQIFNSFHWPIYNYIRNQKQKHTSKYGPMTPLLVGISAPQGCGKTTMTDVLKDMFSVENMNTISLSLDDFYLTGHDQELLAQRHPSNKLLQYRGNGKK